LSIVALGVAAAETYSTVYNVDIPEWIGAVFAVSVIGTAFRYGYLTRHRRVDTITLTHHHHDIPSIDGNTNEDTESHGSPLSGFL
jgi:hypothetical protein